MIIFDALAWMIIAKIFVYLVEDLGFMVKGKHSPRRQARDARRNDPTATPRGRLENAIGGYVAGLVEDATVAAKKSRRRRAAKKHGRKSVGGIFTDFDHNDGHYYADCDICGWISRPYRIEENAQQAGAEHAKTHKDDVIEDLEENPEPWIPRIIPGGEGQPEEIPEAPDVKPDPTINDNTYKIPNSKKDDFRWACGRCGKSGENYPTKDESRRAANGHQCIPKEMPRPTSETLGKCLWPTHLNTSGICGKPIHDGSQVSAVQGFPGNVYCTYHTFVSQQKPQPQQPQQPQPQQQKGEKSVNFEGTGASAIQDAIGDTASELHDKYEEFDSIAATLADAADNYESRGMAPSTVTLIREAADAATTAATQILAAAEQMDSALADFQATDGRVAEAAQDVGNVADESILLD